MITSPAASAAIGAGDEESANSECGRRLIEGGAAYTVLISPFL